MDKDTKLLLILTALRAREMTVDEFVAWGQKYHNTWAPLFTGLKHDGYIARTGVRRATNHNGTAHVHCITPKGIRLHDSLMKQ